MHQKQGPILGLPCQAVSRELAMASVSGYRSSSGGAVPGELRGSDPQLWGVISSLLWEKLCLVYFAQSAQKCTHLFFQPETVLVFKSY